VGANHRTITNGQTITGDYDRLGAELNVGCGTEFKICKNWSIVTEFGYHLTDNSELDGTVVPAEVSAYDSYFVLSAGVNFLFGKGSPSKKCEPCMPCPSNCPEVKDMTDYARIEDMIVKHIPKEVTKDVLVDRYIMALSKDVLVLVGVNFEFDKSDLLPESYPVLDKSVILLNEKPDVKVEIQGYTDYIGTIAYNQELSLQRAESVKVYLVSKGIAANRLATIGYGKTSPVGDNSTEEGRALNRRIVFRIK
jgi:OOP family OmpA-OmpF porin